MRKTFLLLFWILSVATARAQVIQPALVHSNVWISSSANPAPAEQSLTLTGQVNAECTGTITFLDGSTAVGSAPISTGYAHLQISTLAVGPHSLTASYGGSSLCYSATSSPLNQVIYPYVGSLSPGLGQPQSGLTISGGGFGASQGSSTVTINGVTATVTSWSDTSISVTVPMLSAGTYAVIATVNSITSNSTNFQVTAGFSCT